MNWPAHLPRPERLPPAIEDSGIDGWDMDARLALRRKHRELERQVRGARG